MLTSMPLLAILQLTISSISEQSSYPLLYTFDQTIFQAVENLKKLQKDTSTTN